MKNRTIVAPSSVDRDFSKVAGEKLAYWKQVLPQKLIHYTAKDGTRSTLDFNEEYLTDLTKAFDAKVLGQTPFVLADGDNKHSMNPELFRGNVTAMRLAGKGEAPGLYAKIVFPSKAAAKAVLNNPDLGVSARIREGVETADGAKHARAMIHVCGTMDPQVAGMAPWVPAVDLSFDPTDNVLDLSDESYEGATVAKSKSKTEVPDLSDLTEDEIDAAIEAMTEAQLDAYLGENDPEAAAKIAADALEALDEDDDNDTKVDELRLVGAGAELSAKATQDIELANQAAATANSRATEALKRAAAAEWKEYRTEATLAGVPPHLLDLAAPILNRPEEMVIDLSHSDDEDVNVAEVIRAFVDAARGTVDLSAEAGHSGVIGSDDDPDKAMLDAWDN